MKFVKNDHTLTGIGHFSSNKGYEKTVLKSSPCLAKAALTASLNIQSHDGSPFSLPPSLISCKLSSPTATAYQENVTSIRHTQGNMTSALVTHKRRLVDSAGGRG